MARNYCLKAERIRNAKKLQKENRAIWLRNLGKRKSEREPYNDVPAGFSLFGDKNPFQKKRRNGMSNRYIPITLNLPKPTEVQEDVEQQEIPVATYSIGEKFALSKFFKALTEGAQVA